MALAAVALQGCGGGNEEFLDQPGQEQAFASAAPTASAADAPAAPLALSGEV